MSFICKKRKLEEHTNSSNKIVKYSTILLEVKGPDDESLETFEKEFPNPIDYYEKKYLEKGWTGKHEDFDVKIHSFNKFIDPDAINFFRNFHSFQEKQYLQHDFYIVQLNKEIVENKIDDVNHNIYNFNDNCHYLIWVRVAADDEFESDKDLRPEILSFHTNYKEALEDFNDSSYKYDKLRSMLELVEISKDPIKPASIIKMRRLH